MVDHSDISARLSETFWLPVIRPIGRSIGEKGLRSTVRIFDLAMATNPVSGERSGERNIPGALIDEARRHVYEAAIHTPLVRLNYDGPFDIYL